VRQRVELRIKRTLGVLRHLFLRFRRSSSAGSKKEQENVPQCGYSRAATVAVMQAAHHRLGNDPAMLRRLHRTRLRSIVPQPHVRPRLVIIGQVII
jgi:hypothetical protein